MGSDLKITNLLQEYIIDHGLKLHPVQKEIINYNTSLGDIKKMQISISQCQFLHLIIKTTNIKNILEIGTFTGLSTLSMALALTENGKITTLDKNEETKSTDVSVLGSIAAGTPIEAIQQEVDRVALPEDLQNNGEHYGLKVKGDSMIEAGINDGDTVIVKKTSNVDSGQIAVVLIDDQEATLKRVRKKGNTIALEAANRNYGTKIYAANRIKIQGKLISLYRNFH